MFAARDQTKHLSMIVDSGRSAFGVPCSQTFLDKRDKVECSVAVGDRWRRLDPRRDRGLALWCVQSLALKDQEVM